MKILSYEKDFFLFRQRCEARCFVGRWGGGGGDGRHLSLLPSQCGQKVCEILPKYFASQQRLFCSGMPFVLSLVSPAHPLLVGLAEIVNLSPTPHSSQNFFSVCFQLCESHPSIKPSNHIAESIMCMPTNSLQNRLVHSKP